MLYFIFRQPQYYIANMEISTNFDFVFIILSGFILIGSFNLQKSLGDVIKDEAELSNSQKDRNQNQDKKKKSFLKKRK